MFSSDMASLAYERIYEILSLDDLVMKVGTTKNTDDPAPVRRIQDSRVELCFDLREKLHNEIKGWLLAVESQSGDVQDNLRINDHLGNALVDYGLISTKGVILED